MMKGPLIILSGPSGCGKTTVIDRLLKTTPDLPLRLSVSATTRPRRSTEQDGVQYHFFTREQFQEELKADGFLEWAEVYGNYYGTLKREVEPFREQGVGVILDIDTQGAEQVRQQCPEAGSVFLKAPSPEVYEKRLRARATETEESIKRRLAGAQRELARAGEYDVTVINDNRETAVAEFREFVRRQFEGSKEHAG